MRYSEFVKDDFNFRIETFDVLFTGVLGRMKDNQDENSQYQEQDDGTEDYSEFFHLGQFCPKVIWLSELLKVDSSQMLMYETAMWSSGFGLEATVKSFYSENYLAEFLIWKSGKMSNLNMLNF